MKTHHPDLGRASDSSAPRSKFASTNQKHYPDPDRWFSLAVIPQTSFLEETSGVAKCQLFFQATNTFAASKSDSYLLVHQPAEIEGLRVASFNFRNCSKGRKTRALPS